MRRLAPARAGASRSWKGVVLPQKHSQSCHAPFAVLQRLVVPEADYAIAFIFDGDRPCRVLFGTVLTAVNLNHEAMAMACEIGDVMPDRHLAVKVGSGEIFAQHAPHAVFGVGHVAV